MVLEAHSNQMRMHKLDSNQVFGNWSVSWQKRYSIFGVQQICTVTADVISLVPVSKEKMVVPEPQDSTPQAYSDAQVLSIPEVQLGDSVLFNLKEKEFKGKVLSVHDGWISLRYFDLKQRPAERNLQNGMIKKVWRSRPK